LLHDAGKLVLATRLPSVLAADRALAKAEGVPTYVIEQRRHGYTHAEIGAYLFALWGAWSRSPTTIARRALRSAASSTCRD
jgi:HD-like signal output (HDOD) protein